ncbi:InlB B-repeat-containing protein [Blautia obeum]|nr:InlB B-repeat-containing protein [Blautia obeum]
MLKGIRKIMVFLLTLAVVLSFICQTDPQIFAQSPDVTDDEAEVAVQSDETALPEDEQTVEEGSQESEQAAQEEVTKEETQEKTQEAEAMQAKNPGADEAGSVSVQTILIDPETHFTVTCRFYRTEDKSEDPINTQILSENEILVKPQTPVASGENADKKKFLGWFREDGTEFTAEDFLKTGAQIAGKQDGILTENMELDLFAKFSNVHYVYYKTDKGEQGRILHTEALADGEKIIPVSENYGYKAEVGYVFAGWSENAEADQPDSEYTVSSTDGDFILYPVVKKASWIRFVSNGGTAVDPQLVSCGDKSQKPSDPMKAGYIFDGWFTDEACSQAYTFGQTVETDLTLYAKWREGTAGYKVVYWKETLTDGVYDYVSQESASGATGSTVKADTYGKAASYSCFHYDSKASKDVTIAGDGSTVLNVRYARNSYVFKFHLNDGNGSIQIGGKTYTGSNYSFIAKFGEAIADRWPAGNDVQYRNSSWGWNWYFNGWKGGKNTEILKTSKRQTVTEDLIRTDKDNEIQNYTADWKSDLYKLDVRYWGQNVDDDEYTELTDYSQFVYAAGTFNPKNITGYDYEKQEVTDGGRENAYQTYNFYYTRKTYDLQFYNVSQKPVKTVQSIRFEKDISDQNWTPQPPHSLPEYMTEFAGWYTTPGCEEGSEFSFENAQMPASNLALYAKWTAEMITVTFVTGENATQIPEQQFEADHVAQKPEDPERTHYRFVGWTMDEAGTRPFNFDQILTKNLTLYAQWANEGSYTLTYDANNGEINTPTLLDARRYAGGAKAKMTEIPTDWAVPENSKGFLCWNTEADGTGTDYYPGNEFVMPEEDVILYAKWTQKRKTILTYDYNGGMENGQEKAADVVEIENPNERYIIDNDCAEVTKRGYYFAGWSTSADGSDGVLLKSGDVIRIDTHEEESNVLYAQWKEETPAPMGITDEPLPFAVMLLAGIGMAGFLLKAWRRSK